MYQKREKQDNFSNKSYRHRGGNPRKTRSSKSGRLCRTCESPKHFSVSALSAFAKLAGIRVMMLGIYPVPNIND